MPSKPTNSSPAPQASHPDDLNCIVPESLLEATLAVRSEAARILDAERRKDAPTRPGQPDPPALSAAFVMRIAQLSSGPRRPMSVAIRHGFNPDGMRRLLAYFSRNAIEIRNFASLAEGGSGLIVLRGDGPRAIVSRCEKEARRRDFFPAIVESFTMGSTGVASGTSPHNVSVSISGRGDRTLIFPALAACLNGRSGGFSIESCLYEARTGAFAFQFVAHLHGDSSVKELMEVLAEFRDRFGVRVRYRRKCGPASSPAVQATLLRKSSERGRPAFSCLAPAPKRRKRQHVSV